MDNLMNFVNTASARSIESCQKVISQDFVTNLLSECDLFILEIRSSQM